MPLQRQGRDRPAGLPNPHEGPRPPDFDGRRGDRQVRAARPLRRRRRHQRQRGRGASRVCREGPSARHHDAAGPGQLRPAEARIARHARDARLGVRQLRGPGVRPAPRRGGPLRRPRHRQARHLRPAREDRPHRHRPVEHLEERPRRYPGRRRRQIHPGRADQGGGASRARGLVRQNRRVEKEVPLPLR